MRAVGSALHTEIFDPGELRQRLDTLAVEAVAEGDRWAERDEQHANSFLEALRDES